MTTPIHHSNYRVLPDSWARGYFYGVCKVCPPGVHQFRTAKNMNTSVCEKAVIAHLKDKHGITDEV